MLTPTVLAAHVGPWFGFGPWLLLIPLLWILVIVALLVFFGRRFRRTALADGYGPGGQLSPARQAEATLAERYAKGDIDEVEYRARLEVIRVNAGPPAR